MIRRSIFEQFLDGLVLDLGFGDDSNPSILDRGLEG